MQKNGKIGENMAHRHSTEATQLSNEFQQDRV